MDGIRRNVKRPQGRSERIERALRPLASLIPSILVHLILLLFLARYSLLLSTQKPPPPEIQANMIEWVVDEPPAQPDPPPDTPEDLPDTPELDPTEQTPVIVHTPVPVEVEAPDDSEEAPPILSVITQEPVRRVSRGIYTNRKGSARKEALQRYGGNPKSESAVNAALAWLARHQDSDGKWDADGFTAHCPSYDKCTGVGLGENNVDAGVTGLALLAFLAQGHTNTEEGLYQETVSRALSYLLSIQHNDGRFGPRNGLMMYNHGICSLAVAELYALTGEEKLEDVVQHAINFIGEAQQNDGGWDYTDQPTGRNDMSVGGWQVMAIKSAQSAGIHVPWPILYRTIDHLDRRTLDTGQVIYSDKGIGVGRKGVGMVAVGMVCRQFLGWPQNSRELYKQARIIRRNPPSWHKLDVEDLHSFYYWYYATIAMFQRGEGDWNFWNFRLRDLLIDKQERGGDQDGSWNPETRWVGAPGGRVYSTAINALNLEVYYRHLPVYETDTNLSAINALTKASESGSREIQMRAIELLAQFQDKDANETIADLLNDPDVFVRQRAAIGLAQQGDKRALPVFLSNLEYDNPFVRSQVLKFLPLVADDTAIPALIAALDDEQDFIADAAAALLRTLSGEAFGFRGSAPEAERRQAILRWQNWWNNRPAAPNEPVATTITGEVIETQTDRQRVILNVGSENNVQLGDAFTVLRDGEYVGWVKVSEVFAKTSSAFIISRLTVDEIQQGDHVTAVRD